MNIQPIDEQVQTYRVRLRVLFAKPLTTDETELKMQFGGRDVELKSAKKDEPLSTATWFIFGSGGFQSEESAYQFGNELREALVIASLSSRLGVDVGSNKITGWINEQFARDLKPIEPDERIGQELSARQEVASAMRRSLHKIGLRQGVLRVFAKLNLSHLKNEWDAIYGAKSALFYGVDRLDDTEISDLAMRAISLCGTVVLTLVKNEGTALPSIAATHFPQLQ